jgi:protein-disulfide isomerase-like protein with CxxC motif
MNTYTQRIDRIIDLAVLEFGFEDEKTIMLATLAELATERTIATVYYAIEKLWINFIETDKDRVQAIQNAIYQEWKDETDEKIKDDLMDKIGVLDTVISMLK